MSRQVSFWIGCIIAAAICSHACGQRGEFETSYNKRFLQNSPLIGKTLNDVSIFDEKGRPFSLKDAEGNYTVVVFGCLT